MENRQKKRPELPEHIRRRIKGTRGGWRPGAGRPRSPDSGVSHKARETFASKYPVYVTIKLEEGLRSLRTKQAHDVVRAAMEKGADRFGFRLIHYSLQKSHIHMLCEAEDSEALSRGLQGLFIRIAKRVNSSWDRKGKFFADRYRVVVLRTPKQVRDALLFLFRVAERDGWSGRRPNQIDSFSSAHCFDGWTDAMEPTGKGPCPVLPAKTALLTEEWRKLGRLGPRDLKTDLKKLGMDKM